MRRLIGLSAVLLLATASRAADPEGPAIAPLIPICGESPDNAEAPARAILAGYGTGGFSAHTGNVQAQAFFDNGMQLGHAFAHAATTAAFRAAERADPGCALCVWGEAWSLGPTINYSIDKAKQAQAAELADKAAAMSAGLPPRERALIAALQKRYRDGGGAGAGDLAYARAMDDLARAYPDDSEIAILAADSWMIPAALNNSRAHLDRAVQLLEGVLAKRPEDTGAIHFYIHATEMNGYGVRALPYASKLQALAPAASHLVHMPSHAYFWAGHYRRAEQANLDAVKIDIANAQRLHEKKGVYGLSYHFHNVQFGMGSAMMDGDGANALALSDDALAQVPRMTSKDIFDEWQVATAYFAQGRFAGQEKVASLADPTDKLPFVRVMWRYARGEAAVRRGDAQAVKAELDAIRFTPADAKALGEFRPQFEAAVTVARRVLTGRVAMLEHRFTEAQRAYRDAAALQDARLTEGGDPPLWWFPVRRSLAAALLADGKADAAIREAKASLVRWPWDPVTLMVLAKAEEAMGQAAAAGPHLETARTNWTGTLDVSLPAA